MKIFACSLMVLSWQLLFCMQESTSSYMDQDEECALTQPIDNDFSTTTESVSDSSRTSSSTASPSTAESACPVVLLQPTDYRPNDFADLPKELIQKILSFLCFILEDNYIDSLHSVLQLRSTCKALYSKIAQSEPSTSRADHIINIFTFINCNHPSYTVFHYCAAKGSIDFFEHVQARLRHKNTQLDSSSSSSSSSFSSKHTSPFLLQDTRGNNLLHIAFLHKNTAFAYHYIKQIPYILQNNIAAYNAVDQVCANHISIECFKAHLQQDQILSMIFNNAGYLPWVVSQKSSYEEQQEQTLGLIRSGLPIHHPLHSAVRYYKTPVIQAFFDVARQGIFINFQARTTSGQTALILLFTEFSEEKTIMPVLQIFLTGKKQGLHIDFNAIDFSGNSALSLAQKKHLTNCITILEEIVP